jgi:DNA-directed RNA polymerase subunit beta
MNKLFINNIGDLAEAQRASFYRFLSKGIKEELINFRNPFLAKVRKNFEEKETLALVLVYLYPTEIKLKGPNFNIQTCLKNDMTYSIQLYVEGEYSYYIDKKQNTEEDEQTIDSKKKNKVLIPIQSSKKVFIKQDIFLGEIPLMTEEGTFLINGCERVVISQIIRSPGIYFRKEFVSSRKTVYSATIISNKGLWTKFFLDRKDSKKKKKNFDEDTKKEWDKDRIYIKVTDFKTKLNDIKDKDIDSDNTRLFVYDLFRYFGFNFEEILDTVKYPLHLSNQQLKGIKRKQTPEQLALLIRNLFFNQRIGCFSIGEIGRYKINKKFGLNLPKEITYLTSHDFVHILNGLIELKYYNRPSDDIDDIKNKQIRCIGELLQNQIRIGFYRLQQNITEEFLFRKLEVGQLLTTKQGKLSPNFENDSKRKEWILDPRPLTSSIKEFFKTSQLSQFMDQINPLAEITHKRRISVFGPNGLKRDHISTVIRDIHPSQYGRLCPIETPEGQNAGLIASIAMYGRLGVLGSIETPYFFMNKGKVFSTNHPLFLNPEEESETVIAFSDFKLSKKQTIQKDYLSSKENYIFSVKKLEELNFITTSPLQIISVATTLIPFLEHDDANRALMGSNMQRQAVPLLYTQKPIIGTGLEAVAILDSAMVIKNYSQGIVEFSSSKKICICDLSNQKITYYLKKYNRSNQETSINQKPIVWYGEPVFSGQIIADGPSTNDGELALGRNLTIAYMPWEGYNYEDAIVINERIILEDCLTSIHLEECELNLTYSLKANEKLTKKLPHSTKSVSKKLNKAGIIKIGSYVKEHDVLVGKTTICEPEFPEEKLLRSLFKELGPTYRDTSLRVPHGTEGRVIDVRFLSTNLLTNEETTVSTSYETIRIYIAQIRKIQIGDKLAGRHGNKGIISKVLSRQDMPYLPDGTPVDIIFNPLGVPSRMNVGQVFECLLGLAGSTLGKRYKVLPFDEIYGEESSRVLTNQKLKEASMKPGFDWIFNSSFPGKIFLRDGRTGEYFDNPITVGKSYILKLIHLVEDKIHARATGPYSMITEQPLAGKSQKGGQRFGEMEVWALEAYGSANTLQELLTIKSDDIDGRNDMYESILIRKNVKKPNPSLPEAFLALVRELNALGLEFSIRKFEGGFSSTTDFVEIEKDFFKDLETKLKLRILLSRKKSEQLTKKSRFRKVEGVVSQQKLKKKKIKIVEKSIKSNRK